MKHLFLIVLGLLISSTCFAWFVEDENGNDYSVERTIGGSYESTSLDTGHSTYYHGTMNGNYVASSED